MKDRVFLDTNILIYIYSEDLQHGQIIENKLKIINPFKKSYNKS